MKGLYRYLAGPRSRAFFVGELLQEGTRETVRIFEGRKGPMGPPGGMIEAGGTLFQEHWYRRVKA